MKKILSPVALAVAVLFAAAPASAADIKERNV